MNFGNKPDDDDFPVLKDPSSSAKLASLFNCDSSEKVQSLKYVAPKQPNISSSQAMKPSPITEEAKDQKDTTSILFAAATNLYSHQDGSHKNEGKVMCCITRNCLIGGFALLIYKSSKQVIIQSFITPKFLLEIHPKNYVSFTDDSNVRWSFHINGQKYEQFLTQIGICRALASFNARPFPPWVAQNLSLGEGPSAKENDIVKVTKSQWEITQFKKGAHINEGSENLTLTLDKDFSSWEMALLGSKKNLHFIILIPNSHDDKDGNAIVYELKVENVIPANANGSSGEIKESNKNVSIDPNKSSLISRMAKVGQPMFPPTAELNFPVDSERELDDKMGQESRSRCTSVASSIEEINTSSAKYSNSVGKPYDYKKIENITEEANQPGSYSYNIIPQGSVISYHSVPYQQMHSTAVNNIASEPILSLLLSESRSQNTDLRICMSKITDKLDHVTSKVSSLESSRSKSISGESSGGKYDPEELLRRIVTLVEDNKEMVEQLRVWDDKVQHLNINLTEVMLKNQKLLEEKTELIVEKGSSQQKSNFSNLQVLALQEEKSTLSLLLTESEINIDDLKSHLKTATDEIERVNEENDKVKLDFSQLQNQIDEQVYKLQEKLVSSEEKNLNLCEELEKMHLPPSSTYKGSDEKLDLLKDQLESEQLKLVEVDRDLYQLKVDFNMAKIDNKSLKTQIERLTAQNEQLTVDNKKQKSLRNDDYSKNQQTNEELEHRQLIIEQLQDDLSHLQDAFNSDKIESDKIIAELKSQVNSFEEEMAKRVDTPEMVKKIMNIVYKKFKALFQSSHSYEGEDILNNILVVIRDTTLQYLEVPEEVVVVAAAIPPRETNPFRSPDKQKIGSEFILSRQDHIDKSISKYDYTGTSTDDQQSENSLGSYEILPNDDSESRMSTTLTDGGGKHYHINQTSSLNPPSSLTVGKRGKMNPLQYKIGASSSAETPDEFQECTSQDGASEDGSTLKSLSEMPPNKNILPPNDFADFEKRADSKTERKKPNQLSIGNELVPPPPPPLFSDSENDEDWPS